MKAEEMFKNCGFEKLEENSEAIFYTSIPRYICGICFHKNTKEVSFEINNKDYHFTPNVFAAIAKQMAELGWIELMWRSAAVIKYGDNSGEKVAVPIKNETREQFNQFGWCGPLQTLQNNFLDLNRQISYDALSQKNNHSLVGKSKYLKKGTQSRWLKN